ncbi:HopJ type III effector protein [Motilimonas cestriensis]|uniref:HopJ type III effector protein n=1 Tax=Motilimonas cestriensis TaxID=2742685 RepID=A0ABS8WD58_9GAMM|nr:HopJ type III effector protein [Motilimonas cestriensis]MCE2596205.1 HopJ type III effector protein [Motilimonas cestriensis]
MSIAELISQLQTQPNSIEFNDVMAVIEANYDYTATEFSNGAGNELVINAAGTNEGSCRLFAFAQLNQLDQAQTLALFGRFYREDVLQHPEGTDHANIRNFIKYGWDGITFQAIALVAK